MSLQQETWNQFYPDCLPLFAQHKAEVGESQSKMPLNIDVEQWAAIDRANAVQIITARDLAKNLLGYCCFFISSSLESKGLLCASQSLWFVTKESRYGGLGIRLFMEAVKYLKNRGVRNIYPHRWLTVDSTDLDKFFLSLGAIEIERGYSLWIGEI